MNDDNHDDGLVHSHGWATEPPPSIGELLRPAPRVTTKPVPDETHDDGLVHGHSWASAGHGAR
jgi:hypothetical protein